MYLDWHHNNIRMGAGGYMFRKYFSAMMDKNGVGASQYSIDESFKLMEKSLKFISKIWLKPNDTKKFMFGDFPTIADLSLACEMANMEGIKYPLKEKFPSLHEWLYVNMMSIPGFKKIHEKGVPTVVKNITIIQENMDEEKREAEEAKREAEEDMKKNKAKM